MGDRVGFVKYTIAYDYVGKTTPMGKVPAMAALLDCTDERIDRLRAFAGVEGDVFVGAERAEQLAGAPDMTGAGQRLVSESRSRVLADAV